MFQQQEQEQSEDRTTTCEKLGPRSYESSIHCQLGEKMDGLIIEWTQDNYNILVEMIDGYQGQNDPNDSNYCPEDERITQYNVTSLYLAEILFDSSFESFKPGGTLNTLLLNSNIVNEYLEHVEMYICNCAGIYELKDINLDINNEEKMVEKFLFYYLLQRVVMVNEFIEIRDNTIIMK